MISFSNVISGQTTNICPFASVLQKAEDLQTEINSLWLRADGGEGGAVHQEERRGPAAVGQEGEEVQAGWAWLRRRRCSAEWEGQQRSERGLSGGACVEGTTSCREPEELDSGFIFQPSSSA